MGMGLLFSFITIGLVSYLSYILAVDCKADKKPITFQSVPTLKEPITKPKILKTLSHKQSVVNEQIHL